jgi:iron complex outermembrane receptor protein
VKTVISLAPVISCALAAYAGTSYAQQSSGAAQAPALLPAVTVSATREERDSFDLPVSIDSLDQRTIREGNPQVNLSEA